MFKLGKRSKANLEGIDDALRAVVEMAIQITDVDFSVVEGLRTLERQRELVEEKASWTMNSQHLRGRAVDIYPWVDGETNHETHYYNRIAKAMFKASQRLGVEMEWGGFWKQRDKPHWELV